MKKPLRITSKQPLAILPDRFNRLVDTLEALRIRVRKLERAYGKFKFQRRQKAN